MKTLHNRSSSLAEETDFVNVRMPRAMAEELLRQSEDAAEGHSIGNTKFLDPEYPEIIAGFEAEAKVFRDALTFSNDVPVPVSKITVELTDEQAAVFEKIGKQMRASPGEVILAAACGYVDMDRDDAAAEYSSILFDYVAQKDAPSQPVLWRWFSAEEAS